MRRAASVVLVALALGACVTDTRPETCDEPQVTVELTLTATELTPSNPGVCRDQEVTLVIEPTIDGVIHIHGYDAQVPATSVVAGRTERLTFVASRSGQFPIEVHPADDPQGVGVGVFTVYEP